MSVAFALFTSNASLLPCELCRLDGRVALDAERGARLAGAGWYAQEDVLIRRFPLDAAPATPKGLGEEMSSEALVYLSAPADAAQPAESLSQPFRYRRWLFAHQGGVPEFARVRPALLDALPEFLRRQLRGESDSEAAFALFLKVLRDSGRTDDRALGAALAAQLLSRTARTLQQLAVASGVTRPAVLNFLATNGQVLLATRSGEEPLYYALLEGSPACERCALDPSLPDTEPAIRAHRRRRTVAIASHPVDAASWIELPAGFALAVDASQNVQRLPL